MSVDKDTVRRVARLARLAFPEERLAPMAGELNQMLAWVEQLNEVVIEQGKLVARLKKEVQRQTLAMETLELERMKANNPKPPHH